MNKVNIVHVVAFDKKHCIGKDNQLAWHIPEDLQHFKTITTGGVVIMGRKTYDSIGRPLPNRINHVITRDTSWRADGVQVSYSLDDALQKASKDAQNLNQSKLFIIGGGEIFKKTLMMADTLHITRVDLDVAGDVFYPHDLSAFNLTQSHQSLSKSGIALTFETYEARPPTP